MPEREIDELFGAGIGATSPRSRLIIGLLALGGVLTLIGMICTPVLGAIPLLAAWWISEKEMDRLESGYLPLKYERQVFAIRKGVHFTLFIGLFLFIVQTGLLCFGVPVGLWESGVAGLAQWLESIAPEAVTPA